MNNSGPQDEQQLFLEGPVVVFKWKNAEGWPVDYVSANVEANLGYKKEDLLSGKIKYADFIHKEDLPRIGNEVLSYSSSNLNVFEQEYRLVKPNNEVIWIYDHTTVVRDQNGAITHFYGYILEITKHKRNDEMLKRIEKLKTVGEFAAGMAHEIKNPLTSIKGFLQLMKDGQAKEHYIDIIESELKRIELILNELLILSKPEPGQLTKKDVRSLLEQIHPLLGMQAMQKHIQLVTELGKEKLMVHCNENQLKQVFVNLVKNATEAMPNGGTIVIKCKKEKEKVSICFIDEGVGISPEDAERLGTPFFTTKENGNGLGLMVSFGIIEKHGGTIDIKSEVGKGSIFTVNLPAC